VVRVRNQKVTTFLILWKERRVSRLRGYLCKGRLYPGRNEQLRSSLRAQREPVLALLRPLLRPRKRGIVRGDV